MAISTISTFNCKRCGNCCKNIENLAIFEWEAERLKKYGVRIKPALSFSINGSKIIFQWALEGKNGKRCPFLTKTGCVIYNARPLVCRAFPFMNSGLNSKKFEKVLSNECKNLVVPFPKNKASKMKKKEAIEALSRVYGKTFISAVRLDMAREWVKQLSEYVAKSRIIPEEKEIGLLEMIKKYHLMEEKEIKQEIEKIQKEPIEIDF